MQQLLQEMGPDQITVAVSGLASVLGCAVASNRRRMLGLKRTKQISNAVHVLIISMHIPGAAATL